MPLNTVEPYLTLIAALPHLATTRCYRTENDDTAGQPLMKAEEEDTCFFFFFLFFLTLKARLSAQLHDR